jgi:multidrug efflux pump subunit AcrA (membrane-fusion protein)
MFTGILTRRLAFSAIILAAIVAGYNAITNDPGETPIENEQETQVVAVALVRDLSKNTTALPIVGTVNSRAEARILSESQGQITAVYHESGDYIAAGEIIAEIENAAQRAAVAQASAAVDAAQANYDKARRGAREEQIAVARIQKENAFQTLQEGYESGLIALHNAYIAADDAIRNKVDPLYIRPRERNPELRFQLRDYQIQIDLERERVELEKLLAAWKDDLDMTTANTAIPAEITEAKERLLIVQEFLDDIAYGVATLHSNASLSQTTIDTWKASLNAARSAVYGARSSMSGTQDAIQAKAAAYEIANEQYEEILSGTRSEDLSAAQASLEQAKSARLAALSQLEKTILRSPISGTINELSIDRGDFVSAFTHVATVSNNDALEITAFITDMERKNIPVGTPVEIEKKWGGVITKIEPALDGGTQKIQVTVGITDPDASLTHGEVVSLSILLSSEDHDETDERTEFIVPISAIKITTDSTVIFTVDEDNTLIAHTVTPGSILGDKIIITDGLTADMMIVTDARGLSEGDLVSIEE